MPPHLQITRHDGRLWDGYIFLDPSDQKSQRGTYELSGTGYIMTEDGDLVFAGEETGYNFCDEWIAGMTDFRVQEYKGKPYITYWNGCNTQGAHWGHRWGRVTFIDEEYTNFTINPDLNTNTLDDANKGQIDVHEHQMTERNSMVVSSYNNTQMDLRFLGGEIDTWVAESLFFEIDVETQKVLFEWRASDHVRFEDSRWPLRAKMGNEHVPWDWFHINSVQRVRENYLISSRHHWAIYLISGKDGSVLWKLDGEDGGSFGSIPSRFRWQHHVRAQNVTEHGMTISVFNNHVNGKPGAEFQSQALAFWLPLPPNRNNPPQLVRKLMTDSNRVFAATQGAYTMDLGNGNGFVGYGKIPLIREYGPAEHGNQLLWQGRFGRDEASMSYRAFKAKWHGTPKNWDPIAVFEKVRLQKQKPPKVYVSWNGATDIDAWAIFAGEDKDSLRSAGIAMKKGFETVFDLEDTNCVQLGAIRGTEIIRASNIACAKEVDEDVSFGLGDNSGLSDLYNPTVDMDVDQLLAQKEQLEAKVEQLEQELDELDAGTSFSFQLFLGVVCAVVLVVAIACGYIAWRDWRRRKYQALDTSNSPTTSSKSSIFGFGRHKKHASDTLREQDIRPFTDEIAHQKGVSDADFELSSDDEDDEDKESGRGTPSARTPFIRQTTTQ